MIWLAGGTSLVLGLLAGYFLGWRNGHLTGVRYAYKLYLDGDESIPENLLKQYTQETMEKINLSGVQKELAEDEVFQRQLREQENGKDIS